MMPDGELLKFVALVAPPNTRGRPVDVAFAAHSSGPIVFALDPSAFEARRRLATFERRLGLL